jgi:ABC-type multidrug transport system ATPase subunit
VLVEHDMEVVMSISDRITVLDYGQVLAEGEPAAIRENADVHRVYLRDRRGPSTAIWASSLVGRGRAAVGAHRGSAGTGEARRSETARAGMALDGRT